MLDATELTLRYPRNSLQKQRRKYEGALPPPPRPPPPPDPDADHLAPRTTAFLCSLIGVIAYLAYVVFVLPSIVRPPPPPHLREDVPRLTPPLVSPEQYSLVHYGNVALLLVAVTTLVLFFATGMYSEKIAYAHKCVARLSSSSSGATR